MVEAGQKGSGVAVITKKSGEKVFVRLRGRGQSVQRIGRGGASPTRSEVQAIVKTPDVSRQDLVKGLELKVPSDAKLVRKKSGDLVFRKVIASKRRTRIIDTPISADPSFGRIITIEKRRRPVSLVTGSKDARIKSGTVLEELTRKEVPTKIPTITKEKDIKVFEQRVPLKGTMLITKKKVKLTQKQLDKAKKFINKSQKVLLRADRLDKTLNKADEFIQKGLSKAVSVVPKVSLSGLAVSKVPLLNNNFVKQTTKNFLSGAILYYNPITGIPILGARGSQLIDQSIASGKLIVDKELRSIINKFEGDPKAFNSIVRKSASQAVNSVGSNFDPRTPQGLANVLLVLTPVGIKAVIKTPLVNIVSSSAKISKVSALKLINTTLKSIGKMKGVKHFVKTAKYVKQLSKAKKAIRSAQKNLAKLTKQAKKVKKTTAKKLKVVKKEKLSLDKQKQLDKLVLAGAKKLARKKLTKLDVTRLSNLNKVRVKLLKGVDNLIKKSNDLIKSRKKIIKIGSKRKGLFVEKRILNNIEQRAKLSKRISKLESDLLGVIKKKQDIFRKSKVGKEKVNLGRLEILRQSLRRDMILKKDIKLKFKKIKDTKKVKKEGKRDIFIERAIEDIAKLDKVKKSFVKEIRKLVKADKKSLELAKKIIIKGKTVTGKKFKVFLNKNNRFRNEIIKNTKKLDKLKSEYNKLKSFLKSKKTTTKRRSIVSNKIKKDIKKIKAFRGKLELLLDRNTKVFERISKFKGKLAKLKQLPKKKIIIKHGVEVKLRRGRKGRFFIKSKKLAFELQLNKRRIISINKVSKRIKSNIKLVRRTISKRVSTQTSKIRQILKDQINVFKEAKKVDRFIKRLFNEEKSIKQAIKQRRQALVRVTKLQQKKVKGDNIVKEINKLKKDLRTVDDLIEINRQALGLKSKTFVDINQIINDVLRRANADRTNLFRELVKKRSGKANTQATNKVITQNRPSFHHNPFSNQRLANLLEVENVKPIIDALNPTQFGRGFNVGKAISGIIAITKPKLVLTPSKPSIRVTQARIGKPSIKITPTIIQSLIPSGKLTPTIKQVVDGIVKADSTAKVEGIVSQLPKSAQDVIRKVAQRQKQILKQKRKPVKPKKLFLIPLKRDKKIKLGKNERFAYSIRIKRAGRIKVLDIRLPKNRAIKRLLNVLDHSLARSGEIFVIGKTKKKDINAISLKGFRLKRSRDPKVLKIVETSKKALDTKRERSQLAKARKLKAIKRLKKRKKR